MKKLLLLISIFALNAFINKGFAQNSTCGTTFYDNGGLTANYLNDSDQTVTFYPANAGEKVTVSFSSFDTEISWDALYVFDGNSINAPQIASTNPAGSVPGGLPGGFWGTTIPGPFTSTAIDGSLTFRFRSDSAINKTGWVANITCALPSSCSSPTNLVISGINPNNMTIGWTETGNATQWNVNVSGGGTTNTYQTNNNPYLISGLNPNTVYTISVVSVCNPNDYSIVSNSVSATTTSIPPACGGQFMDNGGANALYNNSSDVTTTIYPSVSGQVVTVSFTSFDVEAIYDGLYVYNGNSINAPQIASTNPSSTNPSGLTAGAYYGTTIPGPFTSSAADGSLTFRFRSDSSVNKAGWMANVTCSLPATCPQPMSILLSNINMTGASINWTEMGTATQWEIFVAPAGTAAPTATSSGIIVTSKPYVLSNLNAATAYIVYIRSICSTTDFSAWSNISFTTTGCTAPVFSGSSATINAASVTWGTVANANQQYEIYMATNGMPTPTATTTGVLVNGNTYNASNLICGTSYVFYVRSICTPTLNSPWSLARTVTTLTCVLTTGVPQNMSACSDTGINCFTLTDNNANILGTLNPTDYTITYYLTLANANANASALQSPYCLTNSTQTIYTVLTKIATGEKQVLTFSVASRSLLNTTTVLPVMSACDDNLDGIVILNLTTAPINTTNPLEYYISLANATAQSNPITNPTAYSLAITAANTTIFVREIITNDCDNIYSFQLGVYADCNLAYNCSAANSLCGSLGVPFANTHQSIQAEVGNAYGCLISKPNPTWFYMKVSNSGNINLKIEQNTDITFASTAGGRDVDYVVYGPFTSSTAPCGNLTTANIVSCSFSGAAIEYPVITNAVAGQYYFIMTTNFSNQAGFIKITALPTSTGAIDCSGIRMNAFLDSNANGTQEIGESNFPLGQFHYTVNAGTPHHITSPTGIYGIYDANTTNLYNLSYTIDPAYAADYSLSTASYTGVTVVANGGATTYNFPVSIINNYNDLAVSVLPVNAPRAGTTYKNIIAYANLGNQMIASGTVNFNKDVVTTITTITQAGTTPTATGFSYNFSNLLPFEVRYITVTMTVPSIPTVTIGQLLTNTASIIPPTADLVATNNNSSNSQAIIAAYDPNDKTESHGERILFTSFASNEYLTYTIRFENLGNASAIDVKVIDNLDNQIDETSIKMVAASHPYTLDRIDNNLTWNFDNIQLPVSVANTDIGKGYITFQAKLKPGFGVGTNVSNTANIYFDTNPAVVTNTFVNQFVSVLATNDFELSNFVLYPNPNNGNFTVKFNSDSSNSIYIAIHDIQGRLIFDKNYDNTGLFTQNIELNNTQSGTYLITVQDGSKKVVKRIVIQ